MPMKSMMRARLFVDEAADGDWAVTAMKVIVMMIRGSTWWRLMFVLQSETHSPKVERHTCPAPQLQTCNPAP